MLNVKLEPHLARPHALPHEISARSEERRVGKECQ